MKYLIFKLIPDKLFLKIKYYYRTGKKLNLDKPVTYNEKLQWLKLHDINDNYTKMVDKYKVKEYVASIIGEEYIIPTIGVYDKFDDIDFEKLPYQFVIKCTHDSGGIVICKDKTKLDIESAKKKIEKCLNRNYFYSNREYPYKNVKPKIIIEKYMEDKENKTIRDYKFFCFNGTPEIMYISENSHTAEQSIAFLDMDYNLTDCKRKDYKDLLPIPKKPKNFDLMKVFSKKLSKNIPHVRVDFYEINGKLYFGELTFYTGSGMIPFKNEEWNKKLGDLIDLSLVK